MLNTTTHPSRERLNAYNLGQLPPDEVTAIENHISACEPCCNTIISLSSDDTFVSLLKKANQLADNPSPAQKLTELVSVQRDFPPELAEHPRYEVVRLIGKGGMGDVYEAIHRKMERKVALKVINRELFQNVEAVNRFHREVKTAAQLSHFNVVTSYDADQAGDIHFMVMEYVDGVDLSQIVKDRGALPIAEACDYIRQAAIGLQHAHELGMVHRDIKPHNLMVTKDGTVKILDFGLASIVTETVSSSNAVVQRSDLTAVGAIMGTPDFISPEQALDARQVDIRSDIYSLGTTLCYLLSGRVPFEDGGITHKQKNRAQIEPIRLDAMRKEVPQELVSIALRMMATNPDERYLTPKQVAEALESFLRTWRPNEDAEYAHEPSNGGNMSGSNGQESKVGGSGWNWWLIITRVVLAIACVPVVLIAYESWIFEIEFSMLDRVGYQVPAYLLSVLCLSIIAGLTLLIQRLNSSIHDVNPNGKYDFGIRSKDFIAIAAVFFSGCLATVSYYLQLNKGRFVEGHGFVVSYVQQALDTIPEVDLEPHERVVDLQVSGKDALLVRLNDHVRLQFEGWPASDSSSLYHGKVIRVVPGKSYRDSDYASLLVKEMENGRNRGWPYADYLLPGVKTKGWVLLTD
ncbi:protein kinase domain-containing protein [Pirellulaceae bacterium SH449]